MGKHDPSIFELRVIVTGWHFSYILQPSLRNILIVSLKTTVITTEIWSSPQLDNNPVDQYTDADFMPNKPTNDVKQLHLTTNT